MERKPAVSRLIIFLTLSIVYFPFVFARVTTADSNLYIDMGKHIINGDVFFGFDLYYTSPEKFFPALPFVPPVWPILAGVSFSIGGLLGVGFLNFLFVLLSALVFFEIAKAYLPDKYALMSVLFAYLSMPLAVISIYPWTEGISLFLLSLFLYVVLRGRENAGLFAGLLSGLMFLTRIQYVFPMLVISLFLTEKERKGFWIVFLSCVVLYELFCVFLFHMPYPMIYIHPTNYPLALQGSALSIAETLKKQAITITKNALRLLIDPLRLLFFFGFFMAIKRADKKTRRLLWAIMALVLTYPVLFALLRVKEGILYVLGT